MKYLFELGHQPHISIAEIFNTLTLQHTNTSALKYKGVDFLILETKKNIDTKKLINKLGGTIKIAYSPLEGGKGGVTLQQQITNYLNQTQSEGKIQFSINDKKLGIQIKKELKNLGRSVRYIEPKNTATILHNNLVEKKSDLTTINNEIFVTEAIQPFEEFSQRDYNRPGTDDKSGMLPPKLARIMINLSQTNTNKILLDPFCGSGTTLMEALSLGFKNIIGSDISEKAVEDSEKNIQWLVKSYNLSPKTYNLINADVTELSNHIQPNSVDTIVTEPYMGNPLHGNESEKYLKKQAKELAELYINAFKEFYKILKPGGITVFVIPQFKFGNDWIKIDCLKQIKKAGFELLPFDVETRLISSLQDNNNYLLYHRPGQHLGRGIYKFKKTG